MLQRFLSPWSDALTLFIAGWMACGYPAVRATRGAAGPRGVTRLGRRESARQRTDCEKRIRAASSLRDLEYGVSF